MSVAMLAASVQASADLTLTITDARIAFSPYNWVRSEPGSVQTANPGAYLKFGFTGTKLGVNLDVAPLIRAGVAKEQYPVVRYSVDGGPATTIQLTPTTTLLSCASGLAAGQHTFSLHYVAGYVFLDFWSPVNVVRVTGFTLDDGAVTVSPLLDIALRRRNALFFGDSITNGDDDTATFAGGITNAVDTQDATLGYPAIVAAGIGAEYGIVAYGGASWDRNAADGHTPGLMTSYARIDRDHSRLVAGKFAPVPDDVFVNMGENAGPAGDDVPVLLTALRKASGPDANVFLIVPFSGRARALLTAGMAKYLALTPTDRRTHLIELGDNPYLPTGRPTQFSVDGQHPLAALHAQLGAQIVQARATILGDRSR